MTTDRDSSFMIRNTSFTKQVHLYICKIQIMPKVYLLSRNRNTVHHYYHIADTASVAPAHTKLNYFPMVSFKQTAELQFKVKFAENCSRFNLPVNAKELLFILWTGKTKFWKVAKVETVPIIFVWQTSLPVILLRTRCASISGQQAVCKMYSLICMLAYIKTNIVTYRIRSDAQPVSLCLTGTLSSNKSDSQMLAYIISSNFLLTLLVTSP